MPDVALGSDGKVSLAAPSPLPPGAPMWLQPMTGAVGVPGGSWWQRYRGGTYSFVSLQNSSSGVQIQEQEDRTWGLRLALPPGTGSLISSALSPWVAASW